MHTLISMNLLSPFLGLAFSAHILSDFTFNFYFHAFLPCLLLWQNRLFPEVAAGGRGSTSGQQGGHPYHILAREALVTLGGH